VIRHPYPQHPRHFHSNHPKSIPKQPFNSSQTNPAFSYLQATTSVAPPLRCQIANRDLQAKEPKHQQSPPKSNSQHTYPQFPQKCLQSLQLRIKYGTQPAAMNKHITIPSRCVKPPASYSQRVSARTSQMGQSTGAGPRDSVESGMAVLKGLG